MASNSGSLFGGVTKKAVIDIKAGAVFVENVVQVEKGLLKGIAVDAEKALADADVVWDHHLRIMTLMSAMFCYLIMLYGSLAENIIPGLEFQFFRTHPSCSIPYGAKRLCSSTDNVYGVMGGTDTVGSPLLMFNYASPAIVIIFGIGVYIVWMSWTRDPAWKNQGSSKTALVFLEDAFKYHTLILFALGFLLFLAKWGNHSLDGIPWYGVAAFPGGSLFITTCSNIATMCLRSRKNTLAVPAKSTGTDLLRVSKPLP